MSDMAWTTMVAMIASVSVVVPVVAAPVPADPRWNGSWEEVPARSRLFVPGVVRVRRDLSGAYRIVDENGEVRCGPRAASGTTCIAHRARRFVVIRRVAGPPASTTRWSLDLARRTLRVTTRIVTPRGNPALEWSRYRRVGRPGLVGTWRKVAAGETPTLYTLSLSNGRLHVRTADGLLDFAAPLLARAPLATDRREHDRVYGAVTPRHLVELSFRGRHLAGRSDLRLAGDGSSFVERHVDARGRAVIVFFARTPSAR